MEYIQTITLKDGRTCVLRNGTERDGLAAQQLFLRTHEQTDYLLTYPEENTMTAEQGADYLKAKTESAREIELIAEVEGRLVGMAGIEGIGSKEKVRHRAEFGISIEREFWGLGIGRALTEACVACARRAGYAQLELNVVADNKRALALYRSVGFVEYGLNPRGFRSRLTGWQAVALMRLELNE